MLSEVNAGPLRALIDFIWPPLCLGCGAFYDGDNGICPQCAGRIKRITEPLCFRCGSQLFREDECQTCGSKTRPLLAVGEYQEPLTEIIKHFKFHGIRSPAGVFGMMLVDQFADRLTGLQAKLIIPIPLHPSREESRGYNQAHLLADRIATCLNIKLDSDTLLRVKKGRPHSRLKHQHRPENIRNAFRTMRSAAKNERVILVDDVLTTGATMSEATCTLEDAGFTVVAFVTIAYARSHHG